MYECDSKKFITQSKFKYNNKVLSSNFRLELLTTISINLYSRYIVTPKLISYCIYPSKLKAC